MTQTSFPSRSVKLGFGRWLGLKLGLTLGLLITGLSVMAGDRPVPDLTRTAFEPIAPQALPWDFSDHVSPRYRDRFDGGGFDDSYDQHFNPYRGRDPNDGWDREPLRYEDRDERELPESQTIRERIGRRYRNPEVVRFVSSLSPQQAVALYQEAARLIDARHLEPNAYADRSRQAVKNLVYAVEDGDFLRANRISPGVQQVRGFQTELVALVCENAPRNQNEALRLTSSAMNLGRQRLGLNPSAVALEFVFAAAESQDKYSAFEPEAQAGRPSASLDEQVVGIGVEIKPHDDGVRIVKTLRNGPAAAAGLKSGDLIVNVDGRSLTGRSIDQAVELIGGREGSRIVVGIVRDGRPPVNVGLTRRRVQIHSISEARVLEASNVGYIKLDQFAAASEAEMDQALRSLYDGGMESLIIDLRGNPGGLLTTATKLSDKFLPCGTIVSTRGRTTADNTSELATRERTWQVPLVVLIDENSASASEIFAAAIQENRRGLVVGRRSYGKGTVQTHFPLSTVSGMLRLTTARFYSPTGRPMADTGVEPDVYVSGSWSAEDGFSLSDPDIRMASRVAASRQLAELASSPQCTISDARGVRL